MLLPRATDNLTPCDSERVASAPNHTNQLLDKVEDLLIENSALTDALAAVQRLLPPEAEEKVRSHIEGLKSDPAFRALMRRRFAQHRDLPLEGAVSKLIEQDLAKGIKSTGTLRS